MPNDNGNAAMATAAPAEEHPEPVGPDPSVLETRGSAWPFGKKDSDAPLEDAAV